jgi:Putative lumazine-binding
VIGARIPRRDARSTVAGRHEIPREQEILSIEHTVPDLATAKVRVRIGQTGFIDHLIFHRIDGKWLVTSKAFHVARIFPPGS